MQLPFLNKSLNRLHLSIPHFTREQAYYLLFTLLLVTIPSSTRVGLGMVPLEVTPHFSDNK